MLVLLSKVLTPRRGELDMVLIFVVYYKLVIYSLYYSPLYAKK